MDSLPEFALFPGGLCQAAAFEPPAPVCRDAHCSLPCPIFYIHQPGRKRTGQPGDVLAPECARVSAMIAGSIVRPLRKPLCLCTHLPIPREGLRYRDALAPTPALRCSTLARTMVRLPHNAADTYIDNQGYSMPCRPYNHVH